jgi:hypothetical protein
MYFGMSIPNLPKSSDDGVQTLGITGFLDFVHRQSILKDTYTCSASIDLVYALPLGR